MSGVRRTVLRVIQSAPADASYQVFTLTNTVSNTSVLTQGYIVGNKGAFAAP